MTAHFRTLLLIALTLVGQRVAAQALDWRTAFRLPEPWPDLTVVAHFADAHGVERRTQVWRHANTHLRRQYDGRFDMITVREGEKLRISIADHIHHTLTDTSGEQLAQSGNLLSADDSFTLMRRPAYAYTLNAMPDSSTVLAGHGCNWLRLTDTQHKRPELRICWSSQLGLPLEIRSAMGDGSWRTEFMVESIDVAAQDAATFTFDYPGYQKQSTPADDD